MKKITQTLLIILISTSLLGNDFPQSPFIHVIGESTGSTEPDYAQLKFDITYTKDTYEEVSETINQKIDSLTSTAEKLKIESSDIEAFNVRHSVERDYRTGTIKGYKCTRSVSLTLKKLENYAPLMESIFETEGVAKYRASFHSYENKQFLETLSSEAIENAKEKAKNLASNLSCSVGKVFAVSETEFAEIYHHFFPENNNGRTSLSASYQPRSEGYYIPDRISQTASVNVIFYLKND